MPSAPPQPPQPADGSAARPGSQHAYAPYGTNGPSVSVSYHGGSAEYSPSAHTAGVLAADIFAEALESAMTLVRADGGELMTFDAVRHVFVPRARARHGRLGSTLGPAVEASHPSQPDYPTAPLPGQRDAWPDAQRDPAAQTSAPRHGAGEPSVEQQSTVLLPALGATRALPWDEGICGLVGQRREPVVLRGEDMRTLARGSAAVGLDAAWHLAVPIFRPGAFSGPPVDAPLIGVLSVYRRDSLWSFSPGDIELLALHADRVARALSAMDISRQNASRGELLGVLQTADATVPDMEALFTRVRDIARHLVHAPSFAVMQLIHDPANPDAAFMLAERDGRPVVAAPRPASTLPAWWQAIRGGRVLRIATPDERAAHPECLQLGWGSEQPVQSLLAAPLMRGSLPLGAIIAGSPLAGAYAAEQALLFETLAHTAAIVIEHAQFSYVREHSLTQAREDEHRARENEDQLARLNNAVLTLNASLELEATLQALVQQAAQFTSCQARMVLLLDDDERELVASATSWHPADPHTPLHALRLPLDWQNLRAVLQGEHYIVLHDLDRDWHDGTAIGELLAEYQMQSCLVLPMEHPARQHDHPVTGPLRRESHALGALVVYSPGQHYSGKAKEIQLLQALAGQAAIAISNAKLYRDLEVAYEKQKELDRYKDEFILTVSHEFRTPLTAIDGYVTLISRHGHKLDQQKLDQFAKEIRQATDQLTGMIGTLADVNRMDSDALRLVPVPVNVYAAAMKAVEAQAPAAQQHISVDIPQDLWVAADDERLPRIFSNLVSNALKYAPEGVPCRLVARIESRAMLVAQGRNGPAAGGAPEQWAVLGVRDYGPGIGVEDQARLFQKFVRLSHSLTTAVRGTGLGLWICRQYVTALGGDIWVESTLGSGSLFQFCLPVSVPTAS